MTEWSKTAVLVAAAGALAGLVFLTRPAPKEAALVSDQGQPLAPDLKDPLAIKALEVISYDEAAAKTRAFKVAFDGKRWIIPSHSGYPADAAEKVAAAASAFAGLVKERVVTDNKADHASLGVLSPDDEAAQTSTAGTGTRVTLRDASDRPLVDVIIGSVIKAEAATPFQQPASNKRYVREAGQNRVYITTLKEGFSTKFADWVVTDLLQTTADQVRELVIDRYQIDEERGLTKDPVHLSLTKVTPPPPPATDPTNPPPPPQPTWTLSGTPQGGPGPGEVVNKARVDEAISALTSLKIVGVRPKPANLAKVLGGASAEIRLTLPDQISLSSRGFYLTQGRLLANEGQETIRCNDGVVYSLWFGEVVPDSEDATSGGQVGGAAPATAEGAKPPSTSNARYLMVTVSHDATIDPEPKKPDALANAEAAFAKAKADFDAAHPKPAADEKKPEQQTPDTKPAEPKPETPAEPPPPPSAADEAPKEPPELLIQRQQHEAAVNEWKTRVDAAKKRAESLGRRFADWYYVISADSLGKIRPSREELIKPEEKPAAPAALIETPPGVPTPPPNNN
jgi:hypothetical protein